MPYELLQNFCSLSPAQRDFWEGALDQIVWNLAWPLHTKAAQNVNAGIVIAYVTINGLAPGLLSDTFGLSLASLYTSQSPSEFDNRYWSGSADYRRGRDAGYATTFAIAGAEVGFGILGALTVSPTIPPTAEGTAVGCVAAGTGVGALACVVGGVALGVEVGVTAGSIAIGVHGAGMIVYAIGHPPGSANSGSSGTTGGQGTNSPRATVPSDPNRLEHIFDPKHNWQLTGLDQAGNIRLIEDIANNPNSLVRSFTVNNGKIHVYQSTFNGYTIEVRVFEGQSGILEVSNAWVK